MDFLFPKVKIAMDEIGSTICNSYHVDIVIVAPGLNFSQLVHIKWIVHQQKWQRGKNVIDVIVILMIMIIIIILIIIIIIILG